MLKRNKSTGTAIRGVGLTVEFRCVEVGDANWA